MKLPQGLVDGVGATAALLAGVPYLQISIERARGVRAELAYIGPWLLLAVVATVCVIVLLTIVLRPSHPWLYPVAFAAPTLLFALAAMGELITALFWLALSAATCGIGYVAGCLARRLGRA